MLNDAHKQRRLGRFVAALAAAFIAGGAGVAQPSAADQMLSAFFPQTKDAPSAMRFFGLTFLIDQTSTTCTMSSSGALVCQAQAGALIIFEKHEVQAAALGLMRHNRKERWKALYPSLNQYVEESITIMGRILPLQEAVYFRFDNINWPVLLRSFDVVMTKGTVISVTTICDVRLWPANSALVDNIERSITK